MFEALALGAVLMIAGGIAEILFGVKAERMRLEGIAKPLTAIESKVRDVARRRPGRPTNQVATLRSAAD